MSVKEKEGAYLVEAQLIKEDLISQFGLGSAWKH